MRFSLDNYSKVHLPFIFVVRLGSFGKEHGNGKGKNKKEKDKTKNVVQDKQVKSDIECKLIFLLCHWHWTKKQQYSFDHLIFPSVPILALLYELWCLWCILSVQVDLFSAFSCVLSVLFALKKILYNSVELCSIALTMGLTMFMVHRHFLFRLDFFFKFL